VSLFQIEVERYESGVLLVKAKTRKEAREWAEKNAASFIEENGGFATGGTKMDIAQVGDNHAGSVDIEI
jgi:hypothetical protein